MIEIIHRKLFSIEGESVNFLIKYKNNYITLDLIKKCKYTILDIENFINNKIMIIEIGGRDMNFDICKNNFDKYYTLTFYIDEEKYLISSLIEKIEIDEALKDILKLIV